ncbi:type II toxin-antitoxin system HicB family antitoxin [Streptomyces sp. NPDC086993]|uniref:type II toxin-antitoxin system HicB family antitoxin n=2 Tax=Streptomyces TaxID=1883 RepID=UPI00381DFCE3
MIEAGDVDRYSASPTDQTLTSQAIQTRREGEMSDKATYDAVAVHDGKYWIVQVKGLPENHAGVTQGRTWPEARRMTKDVVALLLDVPEDSFDIVLRPADPRMAEAVARVEQTREEAERAAANALEALQEAARLLTDEVTVRDAGAMLGVSHQYVAKLASRK